MGEPEGWGLFPPPFRSFFSLCGLLVELWPRFKAMAQPCMRVEKKENKEKTQRQKGGLKLTPQWIAKGQTVLNQSLVSLEASFFLKKKNFKSNLNQTPLVFKWGFKPTKTLLVSRGENENQICSGSLWSPPGR